MSSSKILADRMMLDVNGLILSLRYILSAVQSDDIDISHYGEGVLKVAIEDIDNIEKDHFMADNLNTYYDFSIDKYYKLFDDIVAKIKSKAYSGANNMLDDLSTQAEEKLSEHLRESVS